MKKIICILLLITVIAGCLVFAACEQQAGDNSKYYDEITKKCKLEKSYEGKTFLKNGIGVVTVDDYTDGDTTRFKTPDGTVIIRYYGIDTPESTGSVEKWGVAASNFVKSRLSSATEIVLESSTGSVPVTDNYGVRYLGYVWYRSSSAEDFKLLNLEIIENGFSDNKGINTDAYIYYSYMNEANKFARSSKLRIYSTEKDPLFSEDPIALTLDEFYAEPEKYWNDEQGAGAKVMMDLYLESLTVSNSGTYTFTGVSYNPETNERKTINVYAGYSSSAASRMRLGHLYKIIGSIKKHGGAYQISGIVFNSLYESKDSYRNQLEGSYILQKNYYLLFDSSEEYIDQALYYLYSNVTATSVTVENGTMTIVGSANKVNKNNDGETKEFTFSVKVPENYVATLAVGDQFTTQGYQLVENSGNILIQSIADIIKK